MTMKCEKTNIRECAIKSCEARIKHLQNAPPYWHGKRQRLREIELEKVKIAALTLTPPNEPLWMNGWVSVKDALPKEYKRVLVHVVNAPTLDVDTDRIVGGQWVRWAGSITHWMPLPEPPEVNKDADHEVSAPETWEETRKGLEALKCE